MIANSNTAKWFGHRIEGAPVVYAALEGEAGFKLRAQAWEQHHQRALPAGLHFVMQPFNINVQQDVLDLVAVVPKGAVVFIDTLNRSAPTADENSSKDMGEILQGAKQLQSLIAGLVVVIHHTGKDASRGLRGHSSLYAALDAAIEVSRDGDNRRWKVSKSKDGADDAAFEFRLMVETLGVDDYGDILTSCTIQAGKSVTILPNAKLPQGVNQAAVLAAIRQLFADRQDPFYIALEDAISAGAARLACPSEKRRSRAREAITGLVTRGVLNLHEGFLNLGQPESAENSENG